MNTVYTYIDYIKEEQENRERNKKLNTTRIEEN